MWGFHNQKFTHSSIGKLGTEPRYAEWEVHIWCAHILLRQIYFLPRISYLSFGCYEKTLTHLCVFAVYASPATLRSEGVARCYRSCEGTIDQRGGLLSNKTECAVKQKDTQRKKRLSSHRLVMFLFSFFFFRPKPKCFSQYSFLTRSRVRFYRASACLHLRQVAYQTEWQNSAKQLINREYSPPHWAMSWPRWRPRVGLLALSRRRVLWVTFLVTWNRNRMVFSIDLGPVHTGRGAPCNRRTQILEHIMVNGSVHIGCKQHQRVCTQICMQMCLRVLCEQGLTDNQRGTLLWPNLEFKKIYLNVQVEADQSPTRAPERGTKKSSYPCETDPEVHQFPCLWRWCRFFHRRARPRLIRKRLHASPVEVVSRGGRSET